MRGFLGKSDPGLQGEWEEYPVMAIPAWTEVSHRVRPGNFAFKRENP
jgi:hypothetical protein